MGIINFKDYKNKRNKVFYTSEPKISENLYKKNLINKVTYFENQLVFYSSDSIIEKCDISLESCALKFFLKNLNINFLLILQDYSPDESTEGYQTWEFYIHNEITDEYVDSRFISSTREAFKYFISKIKYSI